MHAVPGCVSSQTCLQTSRTLTTARRVSGRRWSSGKKRTEEEKGGGGGGLKTLTVVLSSGANMMEIKKCVFWTRKGIRRGKREEGREIKRIASSTAKHIQNKHTNNQRRHPLPYPVTFPARGSSATPRNAFLHTTSYLTCLFLAGTLHNCRPRVLIILL